MPSVVRYHENPPKDLLKAFPMRRKFTSHKKNKSAANKFLFKETKQPITVFLSKLKASAPVVKTVVTPKYTKFSLMPQKVDEKENKKHRIKCNTSKFEDFVLLSAKKEQPKFELKTTNQVIKL